MMMCGALLALFVAPSLHAQRRQAATPPRVDSLSRRRPIPGAVTIPPAFARAIANGTRTSTGEPGPHYWTQHATYAIDAVIDTATNTLTGTERVLYTNNSPDTLAELAIYLRQNVFRAASQRRDVAPLTNGVTLARVVANGSTLMELSSTDGASSGSPLRPGYVVDGTVMWLALPAPLLPHQSATLEFAWSFIPPLTPADGREGRDDHLYLFGYWYPQVAVYDDVNGWMADPYLLEAEFYMDMADYDVRVTAPRGWVVGATGTLQNGADILSADARAKLARARATGEVVAISRPAEGAAAFASHAPTVTWHFTAPNVRDFAWGVSNRYAWDATRALIAGGNGARDTVDIYSFYRLDARASAWAAGGARYTRDAVQALSDYLWEYPWSTMTSMEGVLTGGGMEYPRLTFMQPWADTLSLAGDLMHETGHMWFPMQVGSSETRFPWMDEGFTQFDAAQGMRALYGEPRKGGRIADQEPGQRALYIRRAAAGQDQILMTPGDLFPSDLYNVMYYDKTAQVLSALRGMLGESTFHRAYREYGRRWLNRHPYPYDFFNTIDEVSKQDLGWFWSSWFFEAWPLDQAIASVKNDGNAVAITVEDRGLAPMPIELAVTRADGKVQRVHIPVSVWMNGARIYVARVARTPNVMRVEIDPDQLFPDIDRTNQLWTTPRGMRAHD
ncbi:MAG TPA: M1 family metallopeptidase [Gemmatimonadaceae bacterium]|nr:M1 family metallopeptidase [Gemmatimonadaceae bacterium]